MVYKRDDVPGRTQETVNLVMTFAVFSTCSMIPCNSPNSSLMAFSDDELVTLLLKD